MAHSSELNIPDLKQLYFERELHPEEELWATLARLGWVGPTPAGEMRDALHHAEVKLRGEPSEKYAGQRVVELTTATEP